MGGVNIEAISPNSAREGRIERLFVCMGHPCYGFDLLFVAPEEEEALRGQGYRPVVKVLAEYNEILEAQKKFHPVVSDDDDFDVLPLAAEE